MATRSRRKSETIDPEDVFPELQPPPQYPALSVNIMDDLDDMDTVTALNSILAELGASDSEGNKGFITVYKETPTKTEIFIGKFEVSEYASGSLLDHLQKTFGGGRYHIRVYAPGGRGVVIRANKWVDIAAGVEPEKAQTQTVAAQPDLSALMAGMQQAMMEGMKQIAATLAPREPVKTTMDMLRELQMMREIFAPAQPPVQPVTQIMDAMKTGMEMAAMNSGGDGNNAWAMKAMEMFGKPIMEAVMSGQIAPARPQMLPAPAQVAQTPVQSQHTTTEDEPMNLMIKGYLLILSKAAAEGQAVEEYADSILNLLPASNMDEFEKMLRGADWQEKLASYSPDVVVHPAWYRSLRDTIIQFIDEDSGQLTVDKPGDSVIPHENDNPGASAQNNNPGGNS
jgi:hypothetical protein